MAKDKGMSTADFAKYYQAKRFEFLKSSQEEIDKELESTDKLILLDEMNKLIDSVNGGVLHG